MPDQDPASNAERLLLHLIDVGAAKLVCPVCGKHDWDILGLVAAIDLVHSKSGAITGKSMMQVVCRTCSYLQHFLWEPIRRKQFPSEALEALRQSVREAEVDAPATFEASATLEGHHGE